MLFHHVGVHVTDFERSRPMYHAIFAVLGYANYEVPDHIATAWGSEDCSFRIVQPPETKVSASSSHICFAAPSEAAVSEFYRVGQEAGGTGVADPESYEEFGRRHLTAMLRDFDGNLIEAVYVDPTPASQRG